MTSDNENSSTGTATKSRRRLLKGWQSPHELEMRAQALARLKEECSSTPWYVEQAAKHGEVFWESLFNKAPLEYRDDLRALKKR